jgi:hypothetical protein
MKKILLSVLIISISFMCSACQNTDASLRRETARSIGNLTPDQITLSDVDRGMNNVDWQAITPKGKYKCSADDNLRRVNCVKK